MSRFFRVRIRAIVFSITLLCNLLGHSPTNGQEWAAEVRADRVHIQVAGTAVAEYVFRDEKILRPYVTQLKTRRGTQVTRNHPPQPSDANDHAEMHPGLWLAFGDINGNDYWRNGGRIVHRRFLSEPVSGDRHLQFAAESELLTIDGRHLATVTNRLTCFSHQDEWILVWDATFTAGDQRLTFGDQEEMGLGVRMATPLTERQSGQIVNSAGQKTAAGTWGQPADWTDYSGLSSGKRVGITLMAAPINFRSSWWHNRDYGLMVANPFGRAAMKQGEVSQVHVEPGESLRLVFGASIYETTREPQIAYEFFVRSLEANRATDSRLPK